MSYVNNKPVYREFLNNGTAVLRRKDRYFVERKDEGGWETVGHEARSVPKDELGADFGLWKDKEITKGKLWWKKTIRPKDGLIQEDEVLSMGAVISTHHDNHLHRNTYGDQGLYEKLVADDVSLNMPEGSGRGSLDTQWHVDDTRWLYYNYGQAQNNVYLVTD